MPVRIYKNKDKNEPHYLPGVGNVPAGEKISFNSEDVVEDDNFEVETAKGDRKVGIDPATPPKRNN